jgi:hypothetical protein
MARQPGSCDEFLAFWSAREEVHKIWFSLFTPQVGADGEENLTAAERAAIVARLRALRPRHPKLDLHRRALDKFLQPPQTPDECLFARTTTCVSADLRTPITPCQLGGDPDCSRCGCLASMGMKALGDLRLGGIVPVRSIFAASDRIGRRRRGRVASNEIDAARSVRG